VSVATAERAHAIREHRRNGLTIGRYPSGPTPAITAGLNIDRVAGPHTLTGVRRDRHGRGIRGPLVGVGVPISTSPADRFDRIASEAVEHVEHRWRSQLAAVRFAVDLVPAGGGAAAAATAGAIESGGVLLAQIVPAVAGQPTQIVLYRKPIELRARDLEDLEDLVHDVVVQVIANYLGLEPEVVDPGFGSAEPPPEP
jgi:predicted Zn-dependent protease with MMP-like domain